MASFAGQFTVPRLERVISGQRSLESLAAEVDRYGSRRVVLVTGKTLGASALVSRATALLGSRGVLVFDGARQHVPASTVEALVLAIREQRADCLVSIGGGSAIDTAKGAVHTVMRESTGAAIVHIAVPTTLSAGEFTDVAGMTDEATRVKHAVFGAHLAPRTVIADPEATLDTPRWLWVASGIRALDHAVETLYSSRLHPISEPLAVRAIELLLQHLPPSIHEEPGSGLPRRGACQMASWLAVFGLTNAGFGLSHVLGHQIGPRWDVPHGVTSAVMLPHAMRFMAEAVPERFAPIARAFDVPFEPSDARRAAIACVDRAATFIAQFNLATRLRDAGVPEGEMGAIAGHVWTVLHDADLIGRPITRADLTSLLQAAY
jgi:alcohol dehydrogenase class IV